MKSNFNKSLEYNFNEYYLDLCYFVKSLIGNINDAEDIVQEVFCTFWAKKNQFKSEIEIKANLYKSCKNRAIDFLRKKSLENDYRAMTQLLITSKENTRDTNKEILDDIIDSCICSLAPLTTKILMHKINDGMKNKEISNKLEISIKTVEAHISKAIKIFREKAL